MRLHEFEAKGIFQGYGIPVPRGQVARDAGRASEIVSDLGGPVVVKAQVLAGGRGLAGGVQAAEGPEEAGRVAGEILDASIRGYAPDGVLVEERLEIAQEIYLGITVDGTSGRPAVVVSARGGVSIETVAEAHPDAVFTEQVNPLQGVSPEQAKALVRAADIAPSDAVGNVLYDLYRAFEGCEAMIAEINPLAVLPDGSVRAVDAVLEVDNSAVFRHPEFQERAGLPDGSPEQRAKAFGMTYVRLDGEIGLICSGAGLGMATMDLIADRARPANFLETGGGITRDLMAEAMRIVLGQPGLKGVLINIYGGINPIHEGALGVAEVMAEGVRVPVVAKALGNFQEETWAILEAAGVTVVKAVETETAVAEVLRQAP